MLKNIALFLEIITGIFALFAGLVTALWVYTKYVLERGFLPPVQFSMAAKKLGNVKNQTILDIRIHLHNVGSATLVARNIRMDLLYIRAEAKDKPMSVFPDQRRAGRLKFPGSLVKDMKIDPSTLIPEKIRNDTEKLNFWMQNQQKHRGFLILEHDTFVQAGVDQVYTFITMVPEDTICFLTWGSFQYAQGLSRWQERVAAISRRLGLIQYTLKHTQEPHTTEDVFWIADNAQLEEST